MKLLICSKCNQVILKWHRYIELEGEENAIEWKDKERRKIPFNITAECHKCHATVKVDESGIISVPSDTPASQVEVN